MTGIILFLLFFLVRQSVCSALFSYINIYKIQKNHLLNFNLIIRTIGYFTCYNLFAHMSHNFFIEKQHFCNIGIFCCKLKRLWTPLHNSWFIEKLPYNERACQYWQALSLYKITINYYIFKNCFTTDCISSTSHTVL